MAVARLVESISPRTRTREINASLIRPLLGDPLSSPWSGRKSRADSVGFPANPKTYIPRAAGEEESGQNAGGITFSGVCTTLSVSSCRFRWLSYARGIASSRRGKRDVEPAATFLGFSRKLGFASFATRSLFLRKEFFLLTSSLLKHAAPPRVLSSIVPRATYASSRRNYFSSLRPRSRSSSLDFSC